MSRIYRAIRMRYWEQRITPEMRRFWQWFKDNSQQLFNVRAANEPICLELEQRLLEFHPCIEYILGPVQDNIRHLYITPDGIIEAFRLVERIVEAAPPMRQWRISAYRPVFESCPQIAIGEYELSPEDIWFSAKRQNWRVDLTLYIKNYHHQEEEYKHISLVMLDHLIGEKNVGLKTGYIYWETLPKDPIGLGLLPISRLYCVMDELVGL